MKSNVSLMTEGSIKKQMIAFALPIFWGQLFQQMYNMVDAIVVGRYVNMDALAAVTSAGTLVQLLVGFFGGCFTGAGVVISKYFGAGDQKNVNRSIHSSVVFGIIAGFILTVLGVSFTGKFLQWMDTPMSVLGDATEYLRIYFYGAIFLTLFNTASGIFQAVGDSKHPLYYLVTASVCNIILDLIFVAWFKMGVAGAALATVISQGLGVLLAALRLCKTDEIYKLKMKDLKIDREMLSEIIKTGIPAGVQNSVICFANVVVQANVNAFDAAAMAGYGASSKIEGFVFIPIGSFAMALTTFISQNLGAKQYDRAKKGANFGVIVCCTMAELIGVIYFFAAPFLVSLFNGEPEVIALGTKHARIICFFFFLLAFSHCIAGIMRGAG